MVYHQAKAKFWPHQAIFLIPTNNHLGPQNMELWGHLEVKEALTRQWFWGRGRSSRLECLMWDSFILYKSQTVRRNLVLVKKERDRNCIRYSWEWFNFEALHSSMKGLYFLKSLGELSVHPPAKTGRENVVVERYC